MLKTLVLSLYKEDYLQILNRCPFDYTTVVVSGKIWFQIETSTKMYTPFLIGLN